MDSGGCEKVEGVRTWRVPICGGCEDVCIAIEGMF